MNVVERVKSILLTPQTEWRAIEREPGDPAFLFTNYVAILAAIPAVARFIGLSIIGVSAPIVGTVRLSVGSGLAHAIVEYLLTFVVVYVMAMIIDMLAPTFAGKKNFDNALKLAVYSYTPGWLAGIFLLIPGLRILTLLGFYGIYLLWKGLPVLMKSPKDKNGVYLLAVIGCAIVLAIVVSAIISIVF
ncbi:MAG TPA: Yip1 family protein [Xanthobacteraceae bacterium]|nr:Yip1 family protein [Xanthobacteraceae bacterium]